MSPPASRLAPTGCRPNPAYRNNGQYSSVAESNYHGLHFSLVQRPADWASLRVTYTLSKSMNNVGEAFFSSPIDPTNIIATGLNPTTTSAIVW